MLPQAAKNFLWEHDFGASFRMSGRTGIFEVAAWKGARYQFVDTVLQVEWARLMANLRTFAGHLSAHTYPATGSDEFFTVHPTHGDPEDPAPFVQERIDLLNSGATALVEQIDSFERIAVKRLDR